MQLRDPTIQVSLGTKVCWCYQFSLEWLTNGIFSISTQRIFYWVILSATPEILVALQHTWCWASGSAWLACLVMMVIIQHVFQGDGRSPRCGIQLVLNIPAIYLHRLTSFVHHCCDRYKRNESALSFKRWVTWNILSDENQSICDHLKCTVHTFWTDIFFPLVASEAA